MSEKKLQDYAQYYIGCRCLNTWFPEGHKEYDKGWKLLGYKQINGNMFYLENEDEMTWTDSIKPILRRLESMTESEMIFICHLHMPEGWSGVKLLDNSEDDWGMRITYDKETYKSLYVRKDRLTPKAFNYLLKQHFDLFSLIDSGLAIDSATLPKIN